MNRRERTLALAVAALIAGFGLLFLARGAFLKPLRERDKKIANVREQLDKIKSERRAYFTHEELIKRFAPRTFSDEVDQASAKSGEILTRLILQSGLRESDFSRMPIAPSKPTWPSRSSTGKP